MKKGKSAVDDGVKAETLQAMDSLGVKRITQLFNELDEGKNTKNGVWK